MHRPASAFVAAAMTLLAASWAGAQPSAREPPSSITVGLAGGAGNRDESEFYGGVAAASVEVFLTPHFGITAETTRVARSWNFVDPGQVIGPPNRSQGFSGRRTTTGEGTEWSAGIGALMRTRPRRASAFASGGVLFLRERSRSATRYDGCVAPVAFGYDGYCTFHAAASDYDDTYQTWSYHFGAGIDVRITRRLLAYGHLQFVLGSNYWVRHLAGVRVVAWRGEF
jgi:hypothetical protein